MAASAAARRRGGTGIDRPLPVRTAASPVPDAVTVAKFIAGLPMKPATNRLTGLSYSSWGVPTCWSRPSLMTAIRGAHRHRLDLVVGDVDDRRAEALVEAGDLGARLDAQLGVEVGERLVHQEDGRLADDRPAERDALALAAGQLLRLALEQVSSARIVSAASLTRRSISALGTLRSFRPKARLSWTVMCG